MKEKNKACIRKNIKKVLSEVKSSLENADEKKTEEFCTQILKAKRRFILGAGRSGTVASMFAMRLMHLSLETHVVGEATSPDVKKDDILIVVTGSGNTETIFDQVKEAKKKKVKVWCLTADENSKIARRSDNHIKLKAKTKFGKSKSVQPMGSTFEQAALIYLDSLIICLMEELHLKSKEMERNHTHLE